MFTPWIKGLKKVEKSQLQIIKADYLKKKLKEWLERLKNLKVMMKKLKRKLRPRTN